MMNHNNPSEARDLLLDEKITLDLDNGSHIYINIFDPKDFNNNIFEVASEVIMDIDRKRMDLLLLINGLPLTNIELKEERVTYQDAVNQLTIYSKKYTSFLKFIQLMIASNNRETVYFANNQIIEKRNIFN